MLPWIFFMLSVSVGMKKRAQEPPKSRILVFLGYLKSVSQDGSAFIFFKKLTSQSPATDWDSFT